MSGDETCPDCGEAIDYSEVCVWPGRAVRRIPQHRCASVADEAEKWLAARQRPDSDA